MSFKKLFPLRAICTPVRMLATFIAVIIAMNLLEIDPTKATTLPDEPCVNTIGDLTVEQLATATLSSDYIPEMISDETVVEKGHVNRLLAQEPDFYTVLFQNRDGSKSGYLFSQPVKYKDGNGIIRNKQNVLSTDIVKDDYKKDYLFVNPYNDIKTYYPRNICLDKGMILETADIKVELAPISAKKNNTVRMANESTAIKTKIVKNNRYKDAVEYGGVFGSGTALRYSSTYEGFKEDIILYNNTGFNRFSFRLITNGLSLMSDAEGQYHLVNPLTGEYVADIGNIVVYDSGTFSKIPDFSAKHHYEVETVDKDQEYILDVVVDEKLLNNPNTVYPIYIDPDITVSGSGASKTIQDVPIYYNTSTNQGSNLYNHIGLVTPTSWGAGRTLMRFPGLNANSIYTNTAYGITRLKLFLYETSGISTESTIIAYQYTGSSSWTETGATSSNITWDGYSTAYQSVSIGSSSSGYISFNLTNAVYPWKSNSTSYNQGIMLKNSNETATSNNKVFNATEYSSNKPYLSFDYATPTTMAVGTYYNASITDGGCFWYKFIPKTSGPYVFETTGATDTYGELYIGTSATPVLPNDGGGSFLNFKILYQLTAGVEYRLKVRGSSVSTTGSYSLTVQPYKPIATGTYYIRSAVTNQFVDVYMGIAQTGQNIWGYPFNGTLAQRWYFYYEGNGLYSIRTEIDRNYRMHVAGGTDTENLNFELNNSNQLFRLIMNSDGSFKIMPSFSTTRCMDYNSGNMILKTINSSSAQKWYIYRADLVNATKIVNLSANQLSALNCFAFNCYGNGIGKQIKTDPSGYQLNQQTQIVYEAVKKDLGGNVSIRQLSSIDSSINADEFRVAMKCGPDDYHFIRQLSDGTWYNKSGTMPGITVSESVVSADVWYPRWTPQDEYDPGITTSIQYTYETIYFAVKKAWSP